MKKRFLQLALILSVLLLPASLLVAFQDDGSPRVTTVLYDGSLGGTPDTQGFTFLAIGAQANQSFAGGLTTLDTMPAIDDLAGYFIGEEVTLNRTLGYEVQFTIQIQEETHDNRNRAGFSLIVLSEDLLGIELGFWTNEIWAQEGGTAQLFRHAEGAAFNTASDLIVYRLAIAGDAYTLFANDAQILTGPIRDYTAFSGAIDPYETPNLVFMGDNTRRAQTKSAVSYVALETTELATATPTMTAINMATATLTPSPTLAATATANPTATPSPTPEPTRLYFWWLPCTAGYPK